MKLVFKNDSLYFLTKCFYKDSFTEKYRVVENVLTAIIFGIFMLFICFIETFILPFELLACIKIRRGK